jgi:hypothetical protein
MQPSAVVAGIAVDFSVVADVPARVVRRLERDPWVPVTRAGG